MEISRISQMKTKAKTSALKKGRSGFENPAVEAIFRTYPKDLRRKLMYLRNLILDTASTTEGVGGLEETLKWGQPSYLTTESKSGCTVRIDRVKTDPRRYAMYFHCQTNLIATFRESYPQLKYEGNRSVIFDVKDVLPEEVLRHCVSMALTYHLKRTRNTRR
jgi:Domain of unknown function (DU1801)